MCGIAGWLRPQADCPADQLRAKAQAMADALHHRGPDAGGVWLDPQAGLALAHRRLSILDLSEAGAQPMLSASGRFVLSYNGEIYSHPQMRQDLEALGKQFRGHSDTEVIVEAIDSWGIKPTLERMIGMFALAVWDRQTRTLTLVRDRMGIKPLHWGWVNGGLAFASELKALTQLPGWRGRLDRDALTAFLRFCYVPAPRTIYQDVFKLEPGCLLILGPDGVPRLEKFWDTRALVAKAQTRPSRLSDADAITALEDLLQDAVAKRMVADVPVGAFLSGGIDSSLVAALMQRAASGAAHTYSIGFDEAGYDESQHAKAVARHLGTHHTEFRVSAADAQAVIPDLPHWYDEPFADSSQIPTYLVSKLARAQVTVALSGDGGDELFAGYTRYVTARAMRLPPWLSQTAAAAIGLVPPQGWDHLARLIPARRRPPHFGPRLHKLADALRLKSDDLRYLRLLSHWQKPADLVRGGQEPAHLLDDPQLSGQIPDFVTRMQAVDQLTYLPDDILTKVDRASMAVSLEVRVPLLDHRVVDFAAHLPLSQRLRGNQGKWLLRQVLYRYVPQGLLERPKMGFGVPIGQWLTGPLRDWAEDLLSETRLTQDGLFDPAPVRQMWADHKAGRSNGQYPLWDVLMANAWLDHNRAKVSL